MQNIKELTKREESKLNFRQNIKQFPCKPLKPSSTPPTDASKLRFSDIKVMMALGDSITAGFGMRDESFVNFVHEYRGMAGLIGGDKDVPTVYNYFKNIGNKMEGGSVGRSLPWGAIRWPWPIRPHNPPIDKLNGAQSRAKLAATLEQVEYIVSQGRKEPNINFEEDWKILHILIGGNDLFECNLPGSTPDEFERKLNQTLSKVHEKVPKVFVNLYYLFEEGFLDIYKNGHNVLYCSTIWRIIQGGLECMVKPEFHKKMIEMTKEYNRRIDKLAKYWNSIRRKDFFVAISPALQHARLPDRSYSSAFDCFHPSAKTNAELSVSVWNGLQLPFDKKPRSAVKEYICPDENTYLQ